MQTSAKFAYRVSIPLWHTNTQFNNTNQIAKQCKKNIQQQTTINSSHSGIKMVKYSKSFHAICFTFPFVFLSLCLLMTSIHTNSCCVIRLQLFVFQCLFVLYTQNDDEKTTKLHRFRCLIKRYSIWEYYNNFVIGLILNKI